VRRHVIVRPLRYRLSLSSSSTPIVILNLFQDNKRRLPVMLKQVQHDEGLFQYNRRRLFVILKQVQYDEWDDNDDA
jgi:hypothetical protein